MNWLDITLAFVVLISVVAGLRKGLSREIIGLVASVLAMILGLWFYHSAGEKLAPYVSSEWAASLGGFLIVFFGVLIAGAILSAVVGRLLRTIGLSPIDRILGAGFGLIRGALIAFGLVTLMIAFLPLEKDRQLPEAVIQSRMAPYLIELSHVVEPLAPKGLKQSFEDRYRQVKKKAEL